MMILMSVLQWIMNAIITTSVVNWNRIVFGIKSLSIFGPKLPVRLRYRLRKLSDSKFCNLSTKTDIK